MGENRTIRPLTADDMDSWVAILGNAYPAMEMNTRAAQAERASQARERVDATPGARWYGLFAEETLLGGMRLYDFAMTLFEKPTLVGGVGAVAVDLTHKKEHVARDLVAYYMRHYRQLGAPVGILYPFRPDFYGAMGFGYGPKQNSYRIMPSALPARGDRSCVRFLTEADRPALIELHNAVASRTHGMIALTTESSASYLIQPDLRIVGWFDPASGALRGYLAFSLELIDKRANFLLQDLEVQELIYAESDALLGLLAFLRTQQDQVRAIILHTLDDAFHYLLSDPRNGADRPTPHVYHESNTQGVGLMYRLLDVRGFFTALSDHRFGTETLTLRLTIHDSFLPEQDGNVVVAFTGGLARLQTDETPADVELTLAVGDASALLMGCVGLHSLYSLGLAELSDASAVERLDALFRVARPPVCLTPF
jgi:predicted acetyltransferase